jgi:AcrR family transcriptional regulator
MREGKIDRRTEYTRALLKETLVGMLHERHIAKISVKVLCDAADINRSTFYAHYTDPYHLLHEVEQDVLEKLSYYLAQQQAPGIPITEYKLRGILEYAKENAALFMALLSENCDASFQKGLTEFVQFLPVNDQVYANQRTKDYLVVFAISGCISALLKWLQEDTPESPEEMAEIILQVLYKGIIANLQQ